MVKVATRESRGTTLKLNGSPVDLNPIPPTMRKVIAALDRLPDDELITADAVAQLSHCSPASMTAYAVHAGWKDYKQQLGKRCVWGNPRAIRALRAQMGVSA